ncbi:hypothetical protein CLOM_g12412 [Closterium sp. NIES-68]|nr:hypothetical protein CLOM_g12412 [Closterium sp. NIES-68]GJP73252.1 hypothetical protein CLOP_g3995 [Closterium sp. NIES-67]GJP82040.1 hypothetical protein CLOP_g12157 [Closterium sp. NIES-67]
MEKRAVQQRTYSLPWQHSYMRIAISVNLSRQQQQGKGGSEQKAGQQSGQQSGQQRGMQREVFERLLGDSLLTLFGSLGAAAIQASLLVLSCDLTGPGSVAVVRCDKRHEQQVWAAAAAIRHPTLNPSVQVVALASSLLALANPSLHLPTP